MVVLNVINQTRERHTSMKMQLNQRHTVVMVLLAVLLLVGCSRKKPAETRTVPPPQTNQQSTVSKPDTRPAATTKTAIDQKTRDWMRALPDSERRDLQARLDGSANVTAVHARAEKEIDPESNLTTIFEPTQDTKDLVYDARRVFNQGLDSKAKLEAIRKLDGTDHPIVNEIVMMALDDKDPEVRETSLDLIMEVKDPSIVPLVVKALGDESDDIRERALDALEDLDDPKINEALSKALDDENEDIRESAMRVMSWNSTPSVVDSLGKALVDPSPDIREDAIIILEGIADRKVVDVLIDKGMLNDNDTIRENALESLNFLTDQDFENYEQARSWWDKNREAYNFDE